MHDATNRHCVDDLANDLLGGQESMLNLVITSFDISDTANQEP